MTGFVVDMMRQIPNQFGWIAIELFDQVGEILATALFVVTLAIESDEVNFAIADDTF